MNGSDKLVGCFAIISLFLFLIGFSYFIFFYDKAGINIGEFKFLSKDQKIEKSYQKIKSAYDVSDYDKALNLLSDFTVDYPDNRFIGNTYVIAASIFYQKKDYKNSRKYVEKALQIPNIDNDAYVDAAVLLGRILREYEMADPAGLSYLENAYLKAPDTRKSDISAFIGYQFLYKNDLTNAMVYFNNSSGEEGVIGRARVYIGSGKYPEAVQEYINYFNAYQKDERYGRVKDAFLKQSFYYADQLVQAGNTEKAKGYLLNIVNYFPMESIADDALIKISGIYENRKDYKNALLFINKALNNTPKDHDDIAAYQMAVILYEMNKKRDSIKAFQNYMEKYPGSLYREKAQEWVDIITKDIQYN